MTQITDLKLDGLIPGFWYSVYQYRNLAAQTFAATGAWTQIPPAGAAWLYTLTAPENLTVRVRLVAPCYKALNDGTSETIQFRILSSKLAGGVCYGGCHMKNIAATAGQEYMGTAVLEGFGDIIAADGAVTYTAQYYTNAPVNNIKMQVRAYMAIEIKKT